MQTINNNQSWPSLQQIPQNKCQSETVIQRPGNPDILSHHASAKTRQAIPTCKAQTSYPDMHNKNHCIKGAASKQAVGVRRTQYRRLAELTLQHFMKLGKA